MKKIRKYFEDILYGRYTDTPPLLLRAGLCILEVVYAACTTFRNFLYDRSFIRTKNIPCRVISIGNITVGGTGKTPVVIMTAKMLCDTGFSVAIVSRGYGRKSHAPLVVSDESGILVSPAEAGDEPHIIAQELPGIPVVVGKNRYKAAQLAYERFKPRIIILDDAFQHRRLYRNVNIVTMDAENPFGNDHLLPRGLLRESPFELKRAHLVIVTRFGDEYRKDKFERMIRFHYRNALIFWSKHVPAGLREPCVKKRLELNTIRGKKTAALSNIVNHDSFHRILESLDAEIVAKHTMPDHHTYTREELENIETSARDADADVLVMTAKDERNIPERYNAEIIDKLVLDIEAELIDDKEAYLDIIKPMK